MSIFRTLQLAFKVARAAYSAPLGYPVYVNGRFVTVYPGGVMVRIRTRRAFATWQGGLKVYGGKPRDRVLALAALIGARLGRHEAKVLPPVGEAEG